MVSITIMADPADKHATPPQERVVPDKEKAAKEVKKKYEPATKFIPTEKLRADETVTFPVDI